MMPITLCSPGEEVRIDSIHRGFRLRRRLLSMGINIGDRVEVVSNSPFGVIVNHHGARLAIGPRAASRVFVTPILNTGDDARG